MFVSHEQVTRALKNARVTASAKQISEVLNELYPNPQAGFGVSGFNVYGDEASIAAVKNWHHDSTARMPSLIRNFTQRIEALERNPE